MRYWNHHYNIVTIDGSLWNLTPSSKLKEFQTNFPPITSIDDGQLFRKWHHELVAHCRSHNIFMLPFYLLRDSTTNVNGFTCGDSPDDDLPGLITPTVIAKWSRYVSIGLNNANSPLFSSFTNNLNGYQAIVTIAKRHHPSFLARPGLMVSTYPSQTHNQTLQEFFLRYHDFCRLRGYINNTTASLADRNEQDIFISNTIESKYLTQSVALERKCCSSDDFSFVNLVNTLERLLADQPASQKMKRPYIPYKKPINSLDSDTIHVDRDILAVAMNAVISNPTIASLPTCIICKTVRPNNCTH